MIGRQLRGLCSSNHEDLLAIDNEEVPLFDDGMLTELHCLPLACVKLLLDRFKQRLEFIIIIRFFQAVSRCTAFGYVVRFFVAARYLNATNT